MSKDVLIFVLYIYEADSMKSNNILILTVFCSSEREQGFQFTEGLLSFKTEECLSSGLLEILRFGLWHKTQEDV